MKYQKIFVKPLDFLLMRIYNNNRKSENEKEATAMIPYHEVRDYEHMRKLMASMEANGWVGAPLVIWDDEYLITGSHRYAAAMGLGWAENEIPTIELAEVFAEAGLDFEALHAEHGYPTINEHGILVALLNELPEEIREKYGIDLH